MADITTGWTFGEASEMDWSSVGPGVDLKMLAGADERGIALFKFAPGYEGTVHEHVEAEFSYILEGELISMGVTMKPGGAYAAAGGTTHDEFRTDTGCTLVSVFAVPSS
jgi:anti-sigma factor ChrR (cupin superfamily)